VRNDKGLAMLRNSTPLAVNDARAAGLAKYAINPLAGAGEAAAVIGAAA
jgi:hypothetical protein